MITQGEWKQSPISSTAIIVDPPGDKNTFHDQLNIKAYGGCMIAESIKGEDNRKLICAAPKMFAALQRLKHLNYYEVGFPDILKIVNEGLENIEDL